MGVSALIITRKSNLRIREGKGCLAPTGYLRHWLLICLIPSTTYATFSAIFAGSLVAGVN